MNIEGSVIVGITHDLPGVIDASQTDIAREEVGSEGLHPHPIGAGDERLGIDQKDIRRNTHDLAGAIDPISDVEATHQGAKVPYSHSVGTGDESMVVDLEQSRTNPRLALRR